MMTLFEVILVEGKADAALLSEDTLASTGAQVFTPQEAAFVGLDGIPDDPEGRDRKLIACGAAETQFVASRLESNEAVASFRLIEVG